MDRSIVSIKQAYRGLTYRSFSVFILLQVATDQDLESLTAVNKLLKVNNRTLPKVLDELRRKRYIKFEEQPTLGNPKRVTLLKRIVLKYDRFIKLPIKQSTSSGVDSKLAHLGEILKEPVKKRKYKRKKKRVDQDEQNDLNKQNSITLKPRVKK